MRVEFFYAPFNGKKKIQSDPCHEDGDTRCTHALRPNPLSAPGSRKKKSKLKQEILMQFRLKKSKIIRLTGKGSLGS